jgi:hypothetical protein
VTDVSFAAGVAAVIAVAVGLAEAIVISPVGDAAGVGVAVPVSLSFLGQPARRRAAQTARASRFMAARIPVIRGRG